ncbi:MAG TPA: DNA gyrase inhibitor YacG [Sphingomonas sp.]|jgi:hypothetical protein|uniref:DNA gyrase inhibitor YacG n=1 Tax=Sphingomonas sp. TaxID=28214 RepID=UPI002ED932F1
MSKPNTLRRARNACPVCGKANVPAHDPFCSQGCRDRDLLQWLDDGYRIPGPAIDDSDMEGLDSDAIRPL